MKFHKYHALGNDYLVLEDFSDSIKPTFIRAICNRHQGIGSDGILHGSKLPDESIFALRIFNPDGSEAEKSGNGLRIFARYLWEKNLVPSHSFDILTKGGRVSCLVEDSGRNVTVEMGKASFNSHDIPVTGIQREVINESIEIQGHIYAITCVTMGNPHCVLFMDEVNDQVAKTLGPILETHALFPHRTNVQFVKVIDAHHIQIEIWERGAGYTLSSGSSSCAAAAASVKKGLCAMGDITVDMPGGRLKINISPDWQVTMKGPVQKIGTIEPAKEFIDSI